MHTKYIFSETIVIEELVCQIKERLSSQSHRMVWVGLGWDFKVCLVQQPCSERGYLQLDQVAQSPVQPDLECFQG